MNDLRTVIGFTFRSKTRSKSFVVTTLILVLILSLGVNLPYIISLFSKGEPELKRVGYATAQSDLLKSSVTPTLLGQKLEMYFQQKPEAERELQLVPIEGSGAADKDEALLRQAVADGQIRGYLLFKPNAGNSFYDVIYKSEKVLDDSSENALKTALQNVKMQFSGLTEEQLRLLYAPVNVQSLQISTAGDSSGLTAAQQKLNIGVVYAVMFLLFFSIMGTGHMIASEVTTEKSSRIMEVLITSVSPLNGMFGKIIGMFLVGIMQIALYVIVIVANALIPTNREALGNLNIHLSDIDGSLLLLALLFYLTGYFLFATLYAAVGSIVSRTEELNQAVMPLSFLSMIGFYIGIFNLTHPDSTFVVVCSFIPFFAPYAMVLRAGLSDPPLWEVWASLLIMLVSIYAFGWLSAKIYRTGVLMYGKRPTIKELRKAMKSYRI
ncbi:ABC transporter permease [Paenibacillus hamazuiensis]|uniref:ABC transporter permease n=1 Tax=Paenibacillus hamazuiensis TaxID=2936508 RepID=UPI00200E6521|nr:ABC transporter permease [Paenibacillus hamazuiensis]